MVYTVGEMARMLNVPASTLRYYDKEGLLPFVERSAGGIRMFKDSDYEWLQVIGCLKKAGMSIRDIRQYILLAMQGNSTIGDRLQMFYAQRERLLEQMEQLRQTLDTLNYKCWFYEQAKACGSTEAVSCIVPEEYRCAVSRLRDVPLSRESN
ncbi:MAG: MerR family transcriptional regulator [Christensenellales bacterium]